MESATKQKQKPPLPERKYKHEPFRLDPFTKNLITTISETGKANEQPHPLPPIPPQTINPPPTYQCIGNQPLPIAPQPQQPASHMHEKKISPYELPQIISKQQKQSTSYEIAKPPINNTTTLIPSVKFMEKQNPPPIDFEQLKITANKKHYRSHSLDIINNEDQPHTNEVTYYDTYSTSTHEA